MLKTYVRYLLPGVFLAEEKIKEIKSRDYRLALKMMPKWCFAFSFYDVETIEKNGEILHGNEKNCSGRFYPDAQKIHWKDIPNTPENQILRSNTEGGGYKGYGIKTRVGNWQLHQKDDTLCPGDIECKHCKAIREKRRVK